MKEIREGNKVYTMDDKGVVVAATETTEPEETKVPVEIKVGSRVETGGKRGTVRRVTATMYGDAFAVQFDDGDVGEFVLADLNADAVTDEVPVLSSVDEAKARLETYEELPAYTIEEIREKRAAADKLHRAASHAIRQTGLDFQDRVALDNIILVTANDRRELDEREHEVALDEDSRYKRVASSRYTMSDDVTSYGGPLMGHASSEDASWLDTAIDGMTVTEVTEEDLAVTAQQMVDRLTHEQLASDDILLDAVSYQEEYLGIRNDADNKEKFARFVETARQEKLAKPQAEVKEAATDDLDSFDTSSLFM